MSDPGRVTRISSFGDSALLVEWPEVIDPVLNRQVHGLAGLIRAERQAGSPWREPVPAYASLLAPYDPLALDGDAARSIIARLIESISASREADESDLPALEIRVHYGGQHGPDLEEVARRTGLSPAGVIDLHATPTYRAYLLGFAPGFAYLGSLPEELQLPRRESPRQRVPAGSVAIAGAQTAVYPLSTPGGWHLIGWTDFRPWDVERNPPAAIRPGRAVRFVPRSG